MTLTKKQIQELPDGTLWLHQSSYDRISLWGKNKNGSYKGIWGWITNIVGKCIWHVTKSGYMHTGVIHNGKQWHWLGGKGLTNSYHPVSCAFIYKAGLTKQQHDKGTEFLETSDTSYNYGRLVMLFLTMWNWAKKLFNKFKWFFFSLKTFGENCSAGAGKYFRAMGIDAIIDLIEDLETPKDYYDVLREDDRFEMVGENFDYYDIWKNKKLNKG